MKICSFGTSTGAFVLDSCVLIGADMQGNIKGRTKLYRFPVNKVQKLAPTIGGARAGDNSSTKSAFSSLENYFKPTGEYNVREYKVRDAVDHVLLSPMELDGTLLLGGYDMEHESDSTPQLFSVSKNNQILNSETSCEDIKDRFYAGSGARHAMAYIEPRYKRSMSMEEGIDLLQRGLFFACTQDCYSGIAIEVLVITPDGCREIISTPIKELEIRYAARCELLKTEFTRLP